MFRQLPEDVFDNDHGTVDNDSEVHRTQRQQIGRNAAKREPREGRQQGQRNHEGHYQRRAQASQENEEYPRHKSGAFEEVFEDGVERRVDQPRSVVNRFNRDILRQDG